MLLLGIAVAYTKGYTVYPQLESDIFVRTPQTVILPSAATSATITPRGAFTRIEGYALGAITTVNTVTATNIPIGAEFILMSYNSTHDIVFAEGGNLSLGATARTLTNNEQVLKLLKIESNKFAEIGFFAN